MREQGQIISRLAGSRRSIADARAIPNCRNQLPHHTAVSCCPSEILYALNPEVPIDRALDAANQLMEGSSTMQSLADSLDYWDCCIAGR